MIFSFLLFVCVSVSPRFTKRPSNLNVSLKSDAELECAAYGIPTPTIQWFKNGEPIYASDYFQFTPNQGNLKILGIIAQDEGYYQCLASNELNTIQSVAQLVVISDDYSSLNLQSQQQEQQQHSVDKEYDYLDDEAKVAETSSSSPPPPSSSSASSPLVHLSAPTQLRVVQLQSRSVWLEWQPPATAAATATSPHIYYAVRWRGSDDERRERESNTTAHRVHIDELSADTLYTLEVSAVSGGTRSPPATLQMRTAAHRYPAAQVGPPRDFTAQLVNAENFTSSSSSASSSSLVVKFKWRRPATTGSPPPPPAIVKYRLFYRHMHYGPLRSSDLTSVSSTNHNSSSSSSSSASFRGHQETDADDVNEDAEEGDNAEDDEADNADDDYAQYDQSTAGSSSSSSSGSEDDEAAAANQKGYVDIELPSSPSSEEQQHTNDHFYEFLFDDHLLKYSTYKFELIACTNQTAAADSDAINSTETERAGAASVFVETQSDVPDGAPEDLHIDVLNTSSIVVEWSPPAADKRNGLIVGYKLAVKENERQLWTSSLDSEPRRKLVAGLLPGHKYSLRLTAKTINGSGPASPWSIAETFAHEMDGSAVHSSTRTHLARSHNKGAQQNALLKFYIV